MEPLFEKYVDELMPAIIQDSKTNKVLMLGFMNREAFKKTNAEKRVTFYSRSKKRLWTKGETSGNFLELVDVKIDCDKDTLLVKVNPVGPVCHSGDDTCFGEINTASSSFLNTLEKVIIDRKNNPTDTSYTCKLFSKGIPKIAQKVGEEAVETVIEAMQNDKELFLGETADLMYHLLVLITAKGYNLKDVESVLQERHLK